MKKKQPSPGKRAGRKHLPPWEAKQQDDREERSGSGKKPAPRGRKSYGDREDKRGFDEDRRKPGPRFGNRDERKERGDNRFDRKPSDRRPSRFGDRDERSGRNDNDRYGDRKQGRRPSRFDDRDDHRGRREDNRFGDRKEGRRPARFNRDEDLPREYDGPKGFSGPRPAPKQEQMPLNKYLAHSGISSRRDAAEIVKEGKVKVNGEVVTEPGYKVQPNDKVTVSGKKATPQKDLVYVLLNKPKDFITTTEDPEGRKTVMQLVRGVDAKRLYPVGRLDRNTTGLLLLTNDGDLAQKLSHPKYRVKKIYQVTLDKELDKEHFSQIMAGLELEDGEIKVDSMSYLGTKNEIGIEIHSGRNRIVRRIFEHLGYNVDKLDRVMYAGLTKKNINRGKWRMLSEKEIVVLKHFKS